MTVIISLPHPDMIVMAADSRKSIQRTPVDYHTLEPIGDSTFDYTPMTKLFPVRGVGCVTLWGEVTRAESGFPQYLNTHRRQAQTVEDLRSLVDNYLQHELRADQDGEDIGFHIGGFMPDGTPKLYHVFYGYDRPGPEGQMRDYRSYDHSDYLALYNGRNDFVDAIVRLLVELQVQVGISIFNDNPVQRVILADFITRYISHFTPEVGGEIYTVLIKRNNAILCVRNPGGEIIPRDELDRFINGAS